MSLVLTASPQCTWTARSAKYAFLLNTAPSLELPDLLSRSFVRASNLEAFTRRTASQNGRRLQERTVAKARNHSVGGQMEPPCHTVQEQHGSSPQHSGVHCAHEHQPTAGNPSGVSHPLCQESNLPSTAEAAPPELVALSVHHLDKTLEP
eukprot:CAMPEP_0178397170 /NCGR_PEP_ID=MMETSP0689_2-20121128/14107_1 /TAXON_ID=160604 /ORGANISM="Amphidinium massartii, Strain CS-259" /LENGTH=149 /DNA_ID=CAMNT_0020017869 /DNA_START=359 /DNA_END=805 /DNA_ORIENTATION=+